MSWRKSTRSSSGGNCVEVRDDLSALRDSKRPGPILRAPHLAVLVAAVKADRIGGQLP